MENEQNNRFSCVHNDAALGKQRFYRINLIRCPYLSGKQNSW